MMTFKPGEQYILKNLHRMGQTRIHIVKIFEDNEREFVIYKWFGRHKQWWHYELKDKDELDRWQENGILISVK